MNHAVWKYPLLVSGGEQIVCMPAWATLLYVAEQYRRPCIWARVNPENLPVLRTFVLVGTGHQGEIRESDLYIGTALLDDGDLVLHVFERVA